LPLICNIALEYAIRKVQENQVALKLNGTLLVYADDVNLLRDNTDITKKKTQTLIDTSKEITMLPSHQQNAGQNHDM
jgi:hypothetical protein